MKITGACHCCTLEVEGEADPEKVSICHCTDCQTGTGSAFRVSIPVAADKFKMTGKPTDYVKTTSESGNPRVQAFCPKCGSPIYSTTPGQGQQAIYIVRVGYIPAVQAPEMCTLFHSVGISQVECKAVIQGGWDRGEGDTGEFGVRLNIVRPFAFADDAGMI